MFFACTSRAIRIHAFGTFRGFGALAQPRQVLKKVEPRPIVAVPLSVPTSDARPTRLLALNTISDNPGARKSAKRVGRGIGSGRGKTCGRGHKGQGQRNRRAKRPGFEGGQMSLIKRTPKRGFNQTFFAKPMNELNINTLQRFIDEGRIDTSKPITMKELYECNIVGKIKYVGKLNTSITIEVSKASQSAIKAVENAGGRIVCAYYNDLGIRALTRPDKFLAKGKQIPKRARPKPKIMPYYTSFRNRGYLSPEIMLTEQPFFPEGEYGCPREMNQKLYPNLEKTKEK
eukprot:GSMAST32.ASY1.ANO1.1856.1 assembled CDS